MSTTNFIKTVTYNVLARQLCSNKNFKAPNYYKQYLTPEYRYSKIWADLDTYTTNRYIIYLHNINAVLSGRLKVDFSSRYYDLYFNGYFNYRGIATAVPRELKGPFMDSELADGKELEA